MDSWPDSGHVRRRLRTSASARQDRGTQLSGLSSVDTTDTRTDVSVGSTRNASHAHPAVRPSPNPNVKTRLLQTRRKETRRASTDTKDRRTSEQDVEGGLSDAAFARCPRPPCFAPAEGAVPALRDIGPEVKRRERDVGPVPASRRCASHRRLAMSAPLHCHSRRSFMRCF